MRETVFERGIGDPLGWLNSPGLYFRYLSIEIDRNRSKSIIIEQSR